MIWNDFLVDRNLSKDELGATISQVFSVSPIDVLVINDIAEAKVDKNIRIICERLPVRGDFLMRLCIYLNDSQFKQLEPKLIIRTLAEIIELDRVRSYRVLQSNCNAAQTSGLGCGNARPES